MPRIRTIKPDFFKSEDVSALPLRARLTWIGLWTHCDDHGRTKDNAKLIKGDLWPLDDVSLRDIEEDLAVLAAARRIVRYQDEGKPYLAVVNWHHHQTINRPSKAKHPAPPIAMAPTDPNDPDHCADCARPGDGVLVDVAGLAPAEQCVSEPRATGTLTDSSMSRQGIDNPRTTLTESAVNPHGAVQSASDGTSAVETAGDVANAIGDARFRDGSVIPRAPLTEGSHQERKGKERKGRERAHARETAHSPPAPGEAEPPPRCPRHLHEPATGACGPCADARRTHQRWEQQQAQEASLRQQAKAHARTQANRADIDRCGLCDDHGRIGGRLCAHDPGIAERAKRGAALARAAITKPEYRNDPAGHHQAMAAIDAILAEPPEGDEVVS